MAGNEQRPVRVRDSRRPGWCWAENELIDVFAPMIGPQGVTLYMALCRHARGSVVPERGSREWGELTGMSKDSVLRIVAKMVALGMVREMRSGKAKTRMGYELLDLKDAVALGEDELLRRLAASDAEKTGADRDSLKRAKAVKKHAENARTVAVGDSAPSPSETDLSQKTGAFATDVSPQKDSYQYWKEKDCKDYKTNSPLPPSRGVDHPPQGERVQEPEPLTPVQVRAAWNGVMSEVQRGLRETSEALGRKGHPNLRDGYAEWDRYFADVSCEEFELDGTGSETDLTVVLRSRDPQRVAEGLKKYEQRFRLGMWQFFGRRVGVKVWKREVAA